MPELAAAFEAILQAVKPLKAWVQAQSIEPETLAEEQSADVD